MRSQLVLLVTCLAACGDKDTAVGEPATDSGDPGEPGTDSGDSDCTGAPQPSVLVEVLTLEGADLSASATVTYRLLGEEGTCSGPSDGLFSCGLEEEGVFVITALVDGYDDGDAAATIASDGCHVRTETVTVEMEVAVDGG